MRSCASDPFAGRQRVLSFRGGVVAAVLVAAMLSPASGNASSVSVTLHVSALQPFTTATIAECSVSVAEDADGVQVLAAAEKAGCIESYETQEFQGFGRFVNCINAICGTAATYWRMTENGAATDYGVDAFRAAAGDELGFSYTTWAGCLVDEPFC